MLTVVNGDIDLGNDLKYGQTYKFDYTIKNVSSSDIHVNRVYVGCTSCTKASIVDGQLKPGDETKINVEFTPGSTGLQNKSVSLAYSLVDKNSVTPQKDILLKFKGFVK